MEIYDDCCQKAMKKLPISVIILTYNEELNIEDCLKSVYGWVEDIFIVDSFSTDRTLEIARKYTDKIYQHPFENYAKQRNWAIQNLPIKTDWILNLDADHRVEENLRDELIDLFSNPINESIKGFLITRKTIFMGRWIRYGGHYPVYHAVLFRKNFGKCEERLYDQHFLVKGDLIKLRGAIVDIISDSLTKFVERHNKWATLEAIEQLLGSGGEIEANIRGNPIERRRAMRNFYNRMPLFFRAFAYFIYRYFFRFGFLDGKEGLIFHFLQGFWYRFLVDAKIYEIEKKARKEGKKITEVIYELYGIKINSTGGYPYGDTGN